ncbi:Nn.00g062780.m01.CDS01 [Neocucurbitaria sp. VM-36]
MAQMPYNPTRILQHDNLLYVFQPSSQAPYQFQLGSIDVSSPVVAADLPYTTLYPTLPFLDDQQLRAFTPVLDNGGNLTVYTGDCTQGASGGQVWSFTPDSSEKIGKGSWSREGLSVEDSKHVASLGANFLNGGIAFSSIVGGDAADTGAFFFGGMCPTQNENSDDWQSAANYSNLMVTLQPSSSESETIDYRLDMSSTRGPPIPEAGFTMTGLSPTFSNRSDSTQTQQQNFVLVGGHTSAAFINMSQVALFSLPEQGWTFIGVQQPDTSQHDLAIRAHVTNIDPRSGHTAVLSPDGRQIIVLGGWVGDINTPAEPQYAILNVADGYGGDGDWQWTVPSTSGAGLPDNSGLYGHGATMLPGGVMMITGGYSISSSHSRRKRATPMANTKAYFLNITSHTWTTDYSPPPDIPGPEPIKTGPLASSGQKAGLGIGLGIGLAAVCGLFGFYMWYTRRLKKQREMREKQLQDLAFGAHRYNIEDYSPGFDGRDSRSDALDCLTGPTGSYYFPPATQGGQGWRTANGGDAERTGLLVEIPSPTRGLRRSLSGRPGYAMGRVRGPGHIHPIDELEEEPDEEQAHDKVPLTKQPEMMEKRPDRGASILENAPVLDPFTDSHGRSGEQKSITHSGPTTPIGKEPGQADYVAANWPLGTAAASGRRSPSPSGRLSPDKSTSERTSSNLSERSARSNLSWTSSSGGVIRSASMRASAILNNAAHANPFKTPDGSPTHDKQRRTGESGRQSPGDPRTHSLTSIRSNGYAELDTFHTAHSSFAHLQAEGEALLGGNPERARPGTASSNSNTYRDTEGSNSRAATATPATSFALDTTTMSRPGTPSSAERTRSLTTTMSYHEPYTDNPLSPIDTSVVDNRRSLPAASTPPRRAASDASFWRSRRGKQDWLDDEQDLTWRRNAGDDWGAPEDIAMAERERQRQEWRDRGNLLVNIDNDDQLPTPRTPIRPDQLGIPSTEERPCTPASEGDWDVEAAVERRVVQVMFTVPKSKLRVVNADIDHSSILSLPRDDSKEDNELIGESSSPPSRVKDLAGRFEQMSSSRPTPRTSPRPSPSPSIKSMKIRSTASSATLSKQGVRRGSISSSHLNEK